MGITESQDRQEYETQEDQTDPETGIFSESFGKIYHHYPVNHNINEWNEIENNPPERSIDHFQQKNEIIDRNYTTPARFSGLNEDAPHDNNIKNIPT